MLAIHGETCVKDKWVEFSIEIMKVKTKTTIELQTITRDHLALLGKKDQTFDSLVAEIVNHIY